MLHQLEQTVAAVAVEKVAVEVKEGLVPLTVEFVTEMVGKEEVGEQVVGEVVLVAMVAVAVVALLQFLFGEDQEVISSILF